MCKIDETVEDIKNYLEEKDLHDRKINQNYSERENDFIRNIKNINSMKSVLVDKERFFEILKMLDRMLLGEQAYGREESNEYGYLEKEEVEKILKWIFVQRYVVAHSEDDTDEKPMNIALQDFILDKYDSNVHFFEEILQNIDDAIGRTENIRDIDNNVEIRWKEKQIIFIYPDKGFSFYDLMAITSLGNSIKKGDLELASIGEKGIGFKSVFSVAKQVDIKSKYFSFGIAYDKTRKTSVLQPNYIELKGNGENKTELKISFFDEFDIDDVNEKEGFKTQLWKWLFENEKGDYLNYSPFLFLKNVRKVTYGDGDNSSTISIQKENMKDALSLIEINDTQFLQYSSKLDFGKSLIANRWGEQYVKDKEETFSINRPIEIVFPIVADEKEADVKDKKGLFYSYLPTEMVIDNPIYINVDVHLKSSRGRISESDFKEGSEWNENVKKNLESSLEAAYKAVIANKDNEIVWKVAKKIYLYMSKTPSTLHFFVEKLKSFYEKIKREKVYLNCKKEFVEKENIWSPNISEKGNWDDFVTFCLNQPFPKEGIDGKQYAFDFKWFQFSKLPWPLNSDWMEKLINVYGGIKEFYYSDNKKCDSEKKNQIILWLLEGAMKSTIDKNLWRILFVENADCDKKYTIKCKDEIEKDNRTLFFRNKSESVDDELSIYIYEDVFSEEQQKGKYKKCLKEFVMEKDWIGFVENKLKAIAEKQIEEIYTETIKYVLKIEADKIDKINIQDLIKKRASKVILPKDFVLKIKLDEGQKVYLKHIAEYLKKCTRQDESEYRIFNVGIDSDDSDVINKIYKYLRRLGVKTKPEIIREKSTCTFDKLTREIIPDYSNTSTDPETLLFVYDGDYNEKVLKKYLVDLVDIRKELSDFNVSVLTGFPFNKMIFINPKIISNNGFEIKIQKTGPCGGTTGYPQCFHKIDSFTSNADYDYLLLNRKRKRIDINCGQLIFASNEQFEKVTSTVIKRFSNDEYISIIDYDDKKRYDEDNGKIIKTIITSTPEDKLDKIRWTSIWNKVFNVQYYWPKKYDMKIANFLSCFEYISIKDIDNLFEEGYNVEWPDNNDYIDCINEEVKDYLYKECGAREDILENMARKYCAIEVDEGFEKNFLALEEYKKLNNKGDYSTLIFVSKKSRTKKTEYVTNIVKTLGIELSDAQKKELSDILGEIKEEKKKKIIELQDSYASVSECIFNDESIEYTNVVEQAKNDLPSVWTPNKNDTSDKKEWGVKKWLCEPYRSNGFVFQGYGYRCPICGSSSKIHSLSGQKFVRRVKNCDEKSNTQIPYLHFIVCLNCADMIEGAKRIAIKDYDGTNLIEVIDHFEKVCYCADQLHMYNNSKMKTMKLLMEIDEQEFCEDIKVSFLHLALFAKMRKKDNNE